MVKLRCVVRAKGHLSMFGLEGRATRVTRLVVVLSVCVCVIWSRRVHEMGVTHDLVSSCLIMVRSNEETKLCGMLITFERVWAVGRFVVWDIVFSSLPLQPRAGTVIYRWCFWASPGYPKPQRAQMGENCTSTKMGDLPHCSINGRDGELHPRVSMSKRGTCTCFFFFFFESSGG